MERQAIVSDSLVWVDSKKIDMSRAGHVKSCLNIGRPLPKPKYYFMTDSEPVP